MFFNNNKKKNKMFLLKNRRVSNTGRSFKNCTSNKVEIFKLKNG